MNSILITYSKICRDCLTRYEVPSAFSIIADENLCLTYLKYAEWELAEEMLIQSQKREISCEYCGSLNIQIYDTRVEVDGEVRKSYDFNRDAFNRDNYIFYMIELKKRDGQYTLNEAGRQSTKKEYKQAIIQTLENILEADSNHSYKSHRIGDVSFVASGKFGDMQDDGEIYVNFIIEQFYHTGFSKAEILDVILKNHNVFQTDGFS